MKRFLVAILTLCVAVSCLSAVGCKHNCEKDGHEWKITSVLFEASCIDAGSANYKCEYCGETKTDVIGLKDHSFGEVWFNDKDYHFKICEYCEDATSEMQAHQYDGPMCSICGRMDSDEGLVIAFKDNLTECEVKGVGVGFDSEEVEIPSTHYNVPVVSIAQSAFYFNQTIKKVTLSDSISEINAYAFAKCTELKTFVNSLALKTVGDNAFAGCMMLESVTFYGNVTYIGSNAFQLCVNLNHVTFAVNEGWAFYDGDEKIMDIDFSQYSPEEIATMLVYDFGEYTLERR